MGKKIISCFETDKNYFLAVLGASFLLRLALVIKTGTGGLSPDALEWISIGWSIASGDGFGGTWRPPGYAFFLGGIFFLFGKSVIAAKFANVVLGTATVYLAYLIAASLFNRATARITGLLLSFYPYLIAYCADALSETLLTFMIAASVLTIITAAGKPTFRNLALTGFVCALTALVKSVIMPFFLLAGLWIWWQTGRLRHTLLIIVVGGLTIAPWTLRNYLHYDKGYVMPVSTPWFSLYGSSCDEALITESTGDIQMGPGVPPVNQVLPPDIDYAYSLPLPERDKYCKAKALNWIKSNPDKFSWLVRMRILHFWRLYPMVAYAWQKAAAMATSGLYIPLAVLGFFLALPQFKRISLLPALFLSYTAVHLMFAVTMRYRIPIDPYFIMLAAYAITELPNRLRRRTQA